MYRGQGRQSAQRWMASAFIPWLVLLAGCGEPASQPTVTLLYQVEVPEETEPARRDEILKHTVRVLRDRLPVSGTVTSADDGQIAVAFQPADRDEIPRVRNVLEKYASLQLQVVADPAQHAAIVQAAQATEGDEVYNERGRLIARWVPASPAMAHELAEGQFHAITRERPSPDGESSILQMLLVVELYDVSGEHVEKATVAPDAQGRPAALMTLTEAGGQRMVRLTQRYQPLGDDSYPRFFHLAIVYEGRVLSAPTINAVIQQDLTIEGNFSEQELERLIARFKAGGLPCPVTFVGEAAPD